MKILMTSLIVTLSIVSTGHAACSLQSDPEVKEVRALKMGETTRIASYLPKNEGSPNLVQQQKIEFLACSDGSHGFFAYIEPGNCASVSVFNAEREYWGRVLVTCELEN